MADPQFIQLPLAPQEEWRPVVGWAGFYEVSNQGRVRRVTRGKGTSFGRVLVPAPNSNGYPRLTLSDGLRRERIFVHFLVADAFLGPRPEGLVINHKDTIRENPRAENLEYTTQSENNLHANRLGHRTGTPGERHPFAKLTAEQVREIRVAPGSQRQIARRYGVTHNTIGAIKRGKHWRTV